jgi:hypothetical protein
MSNRLEKCQKDFIMPIQIENVTSRIEVDEKLRAFEAKYGMSSAEFAADPMLDRKLPEPAAIEWNFLLLQKAAFDESVTYNDKLNLLFSSRFESKIESEDTNVTYEKVAA